MEELKKKYETVIGLEVHVELNTKSKAFCGCRNEFGAEPNTNICPSCLGLPGSLPVINAGVVERAVRGGLALNCTIAEKTKFDRKNYYYPDLPKAYQISQYDMPIAVNGWIEVEDKETGKKKIGITRLHMEEDAAKLLHLTKSGQIGDAEESVVDYNRGGVPLNEIVSEPDMRTPEDAYLYLTTLKSILKYIGVSDCNMEEGSLRCDANVSVRPYGQEKFGVKVEIKNMNSFKNVKEALEYEQERQMKMAEAGEKIAQETRLWDASKGKSFSMRSKEESHDYRYFPEPDLPLIELSGEYVEKIRQSLPELPGAKKARFEKDYALPSSDAAVLTAERETADYFEAAVKAGADAKPAANWIISELMGKMNEAGIESVNETKVKPEMLGQLIGLIKNNTISGKIAKQVFEDMFKSGAAPDAIVKEKGLVQITDTKAIEEIIDRVIAANAKAADEIKGGKAAGLGFLVGQVMKESKGKANPQAVNELLKKKFNL